MRNHKVLYPWRVALFVLCCLALLSMLATIPLIAIFVIHTPNGRGLFISLSSLFGIGLLGLGMGGLVDLSPWAFARHYLSQEHKDYVKAYKWADKTWPGPRRDPWEHMNA